MFVCFVLLCHPITKPWAPKFKTFQNFSLPSLSIFISVLPFLSPRLWVPSPERGSDLHSCSLGCPVLCILAQTDPNMGSVPHVTPLIRELLISSPVYHMQFNSMAWHSKVSQHLTLVSVSSCKLLSFFNDSTLSNGLLVFQDRL